MKKFLQNIAWISMVPGIILVLIVFQYRRCDVYQDFGPYKNYSWKYFFQSLGDISTKKLLASNVRYKTFVFGSSRTTSVYACYVERKFKDSRAFHYGNWNESIGGILAKVRLLDSLGYSLSNVIIYLDTDYTFDESGSVTPYDNYLVTHKSLRDSRIDHFKEFISDLSNLGILAGLTPRKEAFPDWHSDPVTNDPDHLCTDSVIETYGVHDLSQADSVKIDSLRKAGFLYARSTTQQYKERQISDPEARMLNELVSILHRQHSRIFAVITPLYDQKKFDPADMAILKAAFGQNLYDFSGINGITNDEYNYPDRKHFRSYISKMIVDSIVRE